MRLPASGFLIAETLRCVKRETRLDLENPNKVAWLSSFPSLKERERMQDALHEGESWTNELKSFAVPRLESDEVNLCEAAPVFPHCVRSPDVRVALAMSLSVRIRGIRTF